MVQTSEIVLRGLHEVMKAKKMEVDRLTRFKISES